MRSDFASRFEKRLGGKAVQQAVAQHFAQTGRPDFGRSLRIATARLRAPGSREHVRDTLAFERDRIDDFDLRAVRQTHRRMDFALQFIRARKIGLC